jgi:hypothetical protein
MRRAMTRAALRRRGISFARFLSVDASGVLGGYLLVAARTDWLRNPVRVRVRFMLYMAGLAGDGGVR